MENKRDWKGLAWLALAAAGVLLLLQGCAALDVAGQRLGERAEGLVEAYCDQPRSVRAIVRWETNEAVKERGAVVIGCAGEEDYDRLRQVFVEPYSEATIDSIIAEVLERGAYTMPDGSVIRLVVDSPEEE